MNAIALKVMKYKKLISIVTISLMIALCIMNFAFAETQELSELRNKINTIATTIRSFGAVLCIVCAVYIGIMFIMSSVNPGLRDNAKKALWGVLFGVIVLLLADQAAGIIGGLMGEDYIDDKLGGTGYY